MKRNITLYLSDILENMDDACGFISEICYDEFIESKMVTNAVIRSIEIMGEATKHVPEEIRERRPDVPWQGIAGMRDKCIHGYVGIDYEIVWRAVKEEIPQIRPAIQSLLDELRRE